ncbi:Trans-resveratrol di-O-methyltransferase [Vitis vinifera]|uniref:Trans-resveratrol di-O-methyltransferase n=1 Tax=Vitis vinifera TaxID=29760 RepID=A0A438IGQ9_VITVI|nr:Trans-resveratrol di-O-methyltransferase [Vitis vinifera]
MDHINGQGRSELFEAQSFIYKHVFSFMDSMSLKCAVQLGIPDAIHNHNQPITLPELASAIQVPPEKTSRLHQLMRLLVHSGFFAMQKVDENQEGYVLTPPSRLLVKGNATSLAPIVLGMLDPVLVTPWHFLGSWLQGSSLTAFEAAHGMDLWNYGNQNPEFFSLIVDVGGGTGTMARGICEAFPHLKCTVLDLPQVVANLPKSENLDYVGGDMFQSIPSADAIFIKSVLHNWGDEDCVKILKRCREAIPSSAEGGKVIIIDLVLSNKKDEHELAKTKLFNDMMMMVLVAGKERCEEEWEKLFLEAGFSHYKITPRFGVLSLIEVYP